MTHRGFDTLFVLCLLCTTPEARSQALGSRLNEYDAIVVGSPVGEPVPSTDGVDFPLSVVRTVEGTPAPGELLTVFVPLLTDARSRDRATQVRSAGCGLYLLRRTDTGWRLDKPTVPIFSEAALSLGDCQTDPPAYPPGASVYERVLLEVAHAAFQRPGRADEMLYELALGSDSGIVEDIMKRATASDQLQLKSVGVAWLISRSDPSGLSALQQMLPDTADSDTLYPVPSALSGYLNPDPQGVHVLGWIALRTSVKDNLRHLAGRALWRIHTKEAVPYLAAMLSSSDPDLIESAVSGLSEYAKGVRIAPDGAERNAALDDAFNPGKQHGARLAEEEFLHIGPFQSPEEEQQFVGAWKNWWGSHQSEFPPVQGNR